jgi:hypothetical protein
MAGLGTLFAPAYTAGDQSSMDAVNQWMAQNYSMTNPKVEETRSPVSFNTGNPAGMVDPEALRALAQGGPYDFDARRNAIAAQVAANQAAAAQSAAAAPAAQSSGFGGFSPQSLGPFSGSPEDGPHVLNNLTS